jgi:hypothetical protein
LRQHGHSHPGGHTRSCAKNKETINTFIYELIQLNKKRKKNNINECGTGREKIDGFRLLGRLLGGRLLGAWLCGRSVGSRAGLIFGFGGG